MIEIKILQGENFQTIMAQKGTNLLSVLKEHGVFIAAPCNGNGTCRGCTVLIEGEGEVLACQYLLAHSITVRIPVKKVTSVLMQENSLEAMQSKGKKSYGIAIDIGTTTLGFALKELESGIQMGQWGCPNSQKAYGADVASRIAACEEKATLEKLQEAVIFDIKRGIHILLEQAHVEKEGLKEIAIAGNAAMLHILQGISPVPIGVAPFVVPEKELKVVKKDGIKVLLFPHAGAFVGGDIVAGVAQLKMQASEKIQMLIDLGTNGEMVLGNKERLIGAATAAGPAFENCFRASGTTGSKVLDLLVLNVRRKVIGKDGLIAPAYRERGIPIGRGAYLTQSQIREIQLAKGAIRTGIDLLTNAYGCSLAEIDTVYLAGGFGFYLNVNSAIRIGMLPKEFKDKIKVIGNSSLTGAFEALGNDCRVEELKQMDGKIEIYNFAEMRGFRETYLEEIAYLG